MLSLLYLLPAGVGRSQGLSSRSSKWLFKILWELPDIVALAPLA